MNSSLLSPVELRDLVTVALDDLKARDVIVLHVTDLTSVTDFMIVASGTSNRHVRSLVEHVRDTVKSSGQAILGVEGEDPGEWVLVDLGDVVLHVMQPEARGFYELERLWEGLADAETRV